MKNRDLSWCPLCRQWWYQRLSLWRTMASLIGTMKLSLSITITLVNFLSVSNFLLHSSQRSMALCKRDVTLVYFQLNYARPTQIHVDVSSHYRKVTLEIPLMHINRLLINQMNILPSFVSPLQRSMSYVSGGCLGFPDLDKLQSANTFSRQGIHTVIPTLDRRQVAGEPRGHSGRKSVCWN